MIKYILVNNEERMQFEKESQLPYGCFNTSIYDTPEKAIRLLNNMPSSEKKKYYVEKWQYGNFNSIVIKGEWLI